MTANSVMEVEVGMRVDIVVAVIVTAVVGVIWYLVRFEMFERGFWYKVGDM